MLQLSPTSPVQGDNFFGRTRELSAAWSGLEHSHLLVSAPRRVGKTSLLFRMRDQAERYGYTRCVYLDVSPCTSVDEVVAQLKPLWTTALQRSSRNLSASTRASAKLSVPGVSAEMSFEPSPPLPWHQQLLEGMSSLPGRTLVLLDELPVVLARLLRQPQTTSGVSPLLYALRTVRQQVTGVRWVFAGSVGLDDLARRYGLTDTINDLSVFSLGAFSNEEAHTFLSELAAHRGTTFTPGTIEHILSSMGWPLPYFLQLTIASLPERAVIDEEAAERALSDAIEAAHGMVHWRDRLQSLLSDEDYLVFRRVLTRASEPSGVTRDVLSVLVAEQAASAGDAERLESTLHELALRDGYLIYEAGRYQFRSDFFRRWWKARYGR